jgi:ribosomal protein L19E
MLTLAIAITTGVITTIMMAADGIHVRAAGRAAIRALTEHQLAHAEEMKGMSRERGRTNILDRPGRRETARGGHVPR